MPRPALGQQQFGDRAAVGPGGAVAGDIGQRTHRAPGRRPAHLDQDDGRVAGTEFLDELAGHRWRWVSRLTTTTGRPWAAAMSSSTGEVPGPPWPWPPGRLRHRCRRGPARCHRHRRRRWYRSAASAPVPRAHAGPGPRQSPTAMVAGGSGCTTRLSATEAGVPSMRTARRAAATPDPENGHSGVRTGFGLPQQRVAADRLVQAPIGGDPSLVVSLDDRVGRHPRSSAWASRRLRGTLRRNTADRCPPPTPGPPPRAVRYSRSRRASPSASEDDHAGEAQLARSRPIQRFRAGRSPARSRSAPAPGCAPIIQSNAHRPRWRHLERQRLPLPQQFLDDRVDRQQIVVQVRLGSPVAGEVFGASGHPGALQPGPLRPRRRRRPAPDRPQKLRVPMAGLSSALLTSTAGAISG